MFNGTQIVVEGNTAADPELRYTPSGTPVTDITVMVNTGHKDKSSGEWIGDEPTRWRVSCWDKLGEHVADSVRRGDRVLIIGRVKTEVYPDRQTGERRTAQRVTADVVALSLRFASAHSDKPQRSNPAEEAEPVEG